jgi:hypothetical protein
MPSSTWNVIAQVGEHPRNQTPQSLRAEIKGLTSGTVLASSKADELYKAYRIMQGEDPHDVIGYSAPKTYSFAHNMYDPEDPNWVTVDYRHHDLMTNMMRPPKTGRGIEGETGYKSLPGRYSFFGDITADVAEERGIIPSGAQATAWLVSKGIELGPNRKVGPNRTGQSYWHTQTGEPHTGHW